MIVFDEWSKLGEEMMKTFNLTHCGMLPGDDERSVLWGLRYPDSRLLVFMNGDISKPPTPIVRVGWERLTSWPPPWPWAYDGISLKIIS